MNNRMKIRFRNEIEHDSCWCEGILDTFKGFHSFKIGVSN